MKPSQPGRSLICSIKESVLKSKCPKIIQSSLNSLVSTTALLPAKKHISIWSIICHLCSLTANWAALTCIISKTLEIWESLGISLQLGGCCTLFRQTLLISPQPYQCRCNFIDIMRMDYREMLMNKKMYF